MPPERAAIVDAKTVSAALALLVVLDLAVYLRVAFSLGGILRAAGTQP
jgi:hypothetical protein